MEYVTTSTGNPDTYLSPTGAVRDSQTGKPRYDLVHPLFMKRLAGLLARGAEKYSERNWEMGQETGRTLASLLRHVYAYMEAAELGDGGDGEDHLAAIAFNAMSLMVAEDGILAGRMPLDLQTVPARLDYFKWKVSEEPEPSETTIAEAMQALGNALQDTYAGIFSSFFNPVRAATVVDFEEANRRAVDASEGLWPVDEVPAACNCEECTATYLTSPVCCISPSDCDCDDDDDDDAPKAEIKDSSWYLAPRTPLPRYWSKLADAFQYSQREMVRVSVAPYNYYFRQNWKHYILVPIEVTLIDDKAQSVASCGCDQCSFVDHYLQDHRGLVDDFVATPAVVVSYPFAVTEDGTAFKTSVFTSSDREVWELFTLQNPTLARNVKE